ncbi:MAG: aminopeptidase [Euryarchaeota archaeon]|nr:aminopeptidase [Euryarchaeota archaeon]
MSTRPSVAPEAKFARSILNQYLKVRPGENVIIEGWSHSLPWATALAREVRRLRAYPLVLYEDEEAFWDGLAAKQETLYGAEPAHEWAALGKTDVYVHMWGPGDKLRLTKLGPRAERAFAWNENWYNTAAKAGVRGARLEIGRPFPSLAKAYGVDEEAWTRQLLEASMVNPAALQRAATPIARALERGHRVRVHDDQGTDLTLGLSGNRAVIATGTPTAQDRKNKYRILSSLPAGSVSVALDPTVAEGTIRANRSCYSDTTKATGGVFEFEGGRLVRQHYRTGWDEMFKAPYAKGGRDRDRPAQLRIGLNPKLHDTPQLEDIEAGAITVAIGTNRFLPGGKNKSRYFGFVINAGAAVEIDGRRLKLPRAA